MPGPATRANALDHIVVVLFENRSLDNVLGHLYGPEDGKTFEGVIGKDLSNPIPEWAEHGADRKVVPYTVATDMDSPNPDSGEEWYHTNTQLFGTIDDHNRFKIGEGVTAPWNAPPPGATPTMDGFVTDYISTFTGEMGRQPTYDEYAQIMTGFTPEQVPVLNGIAREFGVFDHWFCEVPSQTFMNRSFWTAATSSGLVVNSPARKWFTEERRGDDLRAARSARQDLEGLRDGADALVVHRDHPLPPVEGSTRDALRAVQRVREGRRRRDPARLLVHRAELHRRARRLPPGVRSGVWASSIDIALDPPSSILSGEAFLERVFNAYRSATSPTGTNVWNTALLIGWDEPGGTYDHVAPGAGPAARSGRTCGRVRLHVRPFRLPGARDHGLAVGRARLGLQRGVPPHLAHRDAAQGVGPRRCVHPTRRLGAHLRSRVQPRAHRATPRPGPPSKPNPCRHGRWTQRSSARPSAAWARPPDPA